MGWDDHGETIAEGPLHGASSSLPLPPRDSSLPPPPSTEGRPPPPPSDEQPQRPSKVPVVMALMLVGFVSASSFALVSWARSGDACGEADFESIRFGYCTSTPAGWIAAAAQGEDMPLDRFLQQDGSAVITITAVSLTRGQDLARFEQFVRGFDEDVGATTSGSTPLKVDGVDAVAFDSTLEGPDGAVRSREVLFAREGIAWRVTLADEGVGFEASTARLRELLDGWRFI